MRLLLALALAATLFLAACNAPISPGYRIEKQEFDVRFLSSPSPSLHLRADYLLKNVGSTPLDFLDVDLPADPSLGRRNLSIQVDGRSVSPSLTDSDARIPFVPPLPFKDRLTLTIEYDLLSPQQFTPDAFYLVPGDWHPILRTPDHVLSEGGNPPQKWDLRVRVPDGFLVHASGTPRGSSRNTSERAFRFTQRPGADFRPFLLSGRFVQQQVHSQGITVNCWSFHPLPSDEVEQLGVHIASAAAVFDSIFGPVHDKNSSLWVVEWKFPDMPTPEIALSFPAGALVAREYLFATSSSEEPFETAVGSLCDSWVHARAVPALAVSDLSIALCEYGLRAANESRGYAPDSARVIRELVQTNDDVHKGQAQAKVDFGYDPFAAELRREKMQLFVFALEDKLGRGVLNRSLRRMIQARRGQHWTVDDFRSALELESGQNLADFFRAWLYHPGIPDDFRRRYAQP